MSCEDGLLVAVMQMCIRDRRGNEPYLPKNSFGDVSALFYDHPESEPKTDDAGDHENRPPTALRQT